MRRQNDPRFSKMPRVRHFTGYDMNLACKKKKRNSQESNSINKYFWALSEAETVTVTEIEPECEESV